MAEITLNHVYKKYEGGVTAVQDFTLEIPDKEFVIFVGPSGCGKSTTLRMIAGLESISEGELLIDGERMNEVESCNRNIAMVFQSYALYPHMTVFENIAYSMKLKKVPKKEIKERVHEVAQILKIEEILDRKPGQLSGGQKQRVAMGSAIIRKPKVFLMDEPLSNLDAKLRTQMRIELAKLHREMETTIIYVTHDQTEAMTLGTKIVVMKDGFVQQVAPPAEIYNNPANLFVAGFIGAPSMNFFEAWVAVEDGRTLLYLGGNELGKKIYLDGKKGEILQRQKNGEKVILGIRPEDIYEYEEAKRRGFEKNSVGLEEKVIARELLGAEVVLYFQAQGRNQAVRLNPENETKRGENINLYFDTEKLYAFDMDTQENLFYKEDFTHE